jgi:predicted nucleic acid-binding protein
MTMPPCRVVVADANVLINLIHVGRLGLIMGLPGFEFVVPDHVYSEVHKEDQRAALDEAVKHGGVRIESITDPASIGLYVELKERMGQGESACLVLAVERGWSLASDEKKRFRREAESRIGRDRIIGTKDLLVLAIRAGLLTIAEADSDKAILEQKRFKMDFVSFRDLFE